MVCSVYCFKFLTTDFLALMSVFLRHM
jgi:hypothetical protein